jgi:hypothetical protein
MNATDESQVLMFFQAYDKNEGINITRGQVTYHRDPVPITNLHGPDGSMLLPIATAITMLLKAHDHLVATNCGHPPGVVCAFQEGTSRPQWRIPHCTWMLP